MDASIPDLLRAIQKSFAHVPPMTLVRDFGDMLHVRDENGSEYTAELTTRRNLKKDGVRRVSL